MRILSRFAVLLLAAACGGPPAAEARSGDEPVGAVSSFSVHDLAGTWRDQEGAERPLASLGGRVQVLAMVYTHCTHTCPAIVAELKRIESGLTDAERAATTFVLVSLDPERDTPERLKEYAASVRLDPAGWTLLTAGDDEVRELAALLGLRYRAEANAEFSHSNSYLVLDPDGRIVHRQTGLGEDPAGTLAAVRRSLPR